MRRALAALMLLTSLWGAGLAIAGDDRPFCAESCEDDANDGRCSPVCHDCLCCSFRSPAALGSSASLDFTPPPTSQRIEAAQLEPSDAEPREILHVPINQNA